jgi:uncharacterized Zn finger protein
MDFYGWAPYVSAAERRRKAMRELDKRRKQGHAVSPVNIEGRAIAKTFWGKAWCENLERYSDYSNRLPRGRTYVRNGSVLDLQIEAGSVRALVSGSRLYNVTLKVSPVGPKRWKSICEDCGGGIDSLVELLQGRLSKGVMERICREKEGLFPAPSEIKLSCSCPDGAYMCKHVAAVLYGVGARFDHEPELLFRLREVDAKDLMVNAGKALPVGKGAPGAGKVLGGEDLADLFGLDMAQGGEAQTRGKKAAARSVSSAKKAAAKKATTKKATTKTPAKKAVKKAVQKKKAMKKNGRAPRKQAGSE